MNHKRGADISVVLFIIVVSLGVLVVSDSMGGIGLAGAFVANDGLTCSEKKIPYEDCFTNTFPVEVNEKYIETVPVDEKECATKEYSSEAYYISSDDKEGDIWLEEGTWHKLVPLEKNSAVRSRIYNHEEKEGTFTVIIRIWKEQKNVYEKDIDIVVPGDSYRDFSVAHDEIIREEPDDDNIREGYSEAEYILNAYLKRPLFDECKKETTYYIVDKEKTFTEYRQKEVCKTSYRTETVCYQA